MKQTVHQLYQSVNTCITQMAKSGFGMVASVTITVLRIRVKMRICVMIMVAYVFNGKKEKKEDVNI
ncbi:hypothetical protein AT251_23800 [Enterovibrio nigricans]|nr:hypothetical protein AT251_23800 [Enterovibrio nigricans]